ncbi:MAG: outer membrane lipoprotein-sorting protein [Spirochaetales bacterium]|nr:outer membrane lipoprotein-sorting protein [Spirochaetales bacterium]
MAVSAMCAGVFGIFSPSFSLLGQAPAAERIDVPVQELIARVDENLTLPDGLLTGRLTAVQKTGSTSVWDFQLSKREGERLFQFSSKQHGLESRILYREEGEVIYLWDSLRNQLFRKRDFEKFQPIMQTGFSFIDLSGYSFQANYNGKEAVLYKTRDGKIHTRLTLLPIVSGEYSRLVLLTDQKDNYRPLRVDFHDRQGVLTKTMELVYGEVLLRRNNEKGRLPGPSQMEMLNLKTGMITRLDYYTLDDRNPPGEKLFDPDYLNR